MTTTAKPRAPRKPKIAAPPVPREITTRELIDLLSDGLLFASTDYLVPTINSVYLEAKGDTLRAVSTDRYALGIRSLVSPGPDFAFLMGSADVADLIALLRSRTPRRGEAPNVELAFSDDDLPRQMTVTISNLVVTYFEQAGDFVKFESLVKKMLAYEKQPDAGRFGCNASLLARFSRLSAARKNKPLEVTTTGVAQAIKVTCGPDFVGFLMPVRLSDEVRVAA